MARYITWLGQLGTIKASSSQPYMSSVNGIFKDHGVEAIALGDLITKVRKGLAASHVAINETRIHVHLPTSVAFKDLRMAQVLLLKLTSATTSATLHTIPTREHVQLLRACTTIVIIYLLFCRGEACLDCLTENFVVSKEDGSAFTTIQERDNAECEQSEKQCATYRKPYK
jgi:hypothetical protein